MTAPPSPQVPSSIAQLASQAQSVAVLTGAGMSAESGIPTFRDAENGLWARYDPMTLATPEAFADEPDLVWGWYAWRRRMIAQTEPNPGHLALARWAQHAELSIITQNVDDLHERAGSTRVEHLHGSLFALRCYDCERPYRGSVVVPDEQVERLPPPTCQSCFGPVRPGIVWFGEALPESVFERSQALAAAADLLLVIGTSGLVYPAAGIPMLAQSVGVTTIEINPDVTPFSAHASHTWRASAATGLPALLSAMGG